MVPLSKENAHVFDVLLQDYEAEFSAITKKEPDENGRFTMDIELNGQKYSVFLQFMERKPSGFVIRGIEEGVSDIAEFYILPCYRKRGYGQKLAFDVFDHFPGSWQVRQIEGATEARNFWRRIIHIYTDGNFTEEHLKDPYWGPVTRQSFASRKK
jgi:predicted acetyltransferase